jgi:hypothetical protein
MSDVSEEEDVRCQMPDASEDVSRITQLSSDIFFFTDI